MNKLIGLLVLSLVILPSFAIEELRESVGFDGCWYPSDYNCDGFLTDSECTNDVCSSTCVTYENEVCSQVECSAPYYYTGYESSSRCGTFNHEVTINGKLSMSQVLNYNPCAYGLFSVAQIIDYDCVGLELFGTCYGDWKTIAIFSCRYSECANKDYDDVSCEREEVTISNNVIIPDLTECKEGEQLCDVNGNVKVCNSDGFYDINVKPCLEGKTCCDINTVKTKEVCKGANVNSYFAMCRDNVDSLGEGSCTNEGYYQCDQNEIKKCVNGFWDDYETCNSACNYTAVTNNDTVNFCRPTNLDKQCDFTGETMCTTVPNTNDAFFWLCRNDEWDLNKKCASGKCNYNETACFIGCQPDTEFCYAENNSCLYCNDNGEWIESYICQLEVNNVTNECLIDTSCFEDAKRCNINYVIKCVNGVWSRSEECSFGCDAGACIVENEDIFKPLTSFSPFLIAFLPQLMEFIMYMGFVGIALYLLRRFILWVKSQ